MDAHLTILMREMMGMGGGTGGFEGGFEYFPRDVVIQHCQETVAYSNPLRQEGGHKLTTTIVDEQGAVAPCLTPVAELKPVTLRELRAHIGRYAPGRILRLTTLREATQIVAITIPAIDDEGTAILVSVYNQTGGKVLSKAQLQQLYPEGGRILIKNPCVKCSRSGTPMLRVDHPSNVIVEMVERGTRQGATIQSGGVQGAGHAALGVAEAFKKRGNDKFQKGDYCGAIEQYDKALNSSDDLPAALAGTIHTNRAACFLKLEQNAEARAAARKALALDPSNKKALFRLASAKRRWGNTRRRWPHSRA